jgi:uncharacterized protein (TIGR03382 family)
MEMRGLLAGACIVGCAGSAIAGGVVNTGGTAGALGGGEFSFTVVSGFTGEGIGDPGTAFHTFCLELNEHIYLNTNYNATISDAAVLGGNGGPSDPIDPLTAYLYEQFRDGTLAGYSGDSDSQNGLQAAIWYIEDEINLSTLNSYPAGILNKANAFLADANANYTPGSIGRVRVLNLTDMNDGSNAQSELVLLPLPGGAALAGVGLLALVRRRR